MSQQPRYLKAIKEALASGYRVDAGNGIIYGKKGKPLKLRSRKERPYPVVNLAVRAYHLPTCTVDAHKLIAYVLFGDEAFAPGVHVRHLDGNVWNLRGENFALGTPTQNAYDKPPEVRRLMAKKARAAQGPEAWNRKLSKRQAARVKRLCKGGGKGIQAQLARELGVNPSTICRIVKGERYTTKKGA